MASLLPRFPQLFSSRAFSTNGVLLWLIHSIPRSIDVISQGEMYSNSYSRCEDEDGKDWLPCYHVFPNFSLHEPSPPTEYYTKWASDLSITTFPCFGFTETGSGVAADTVRVMADVSGYCVRMLRMSSGALCFSMTSLLPRFPQLFTSRAFSTNGVLHKMGLRPCIHIHIHVVRMRMAKIA
jgi:hypothetical protein